MLMAVSLAEKLGSRGLLAYSLHPGLIMESGLGAHLSFNGVGDESDDMYTLRKSLPFFVQTQGAKR
jgi:hypothetical protein